MDIGIDLGTTFSVIAVKGRVAPVGDYLDAQYLPECDVSIIPSPFGEFTIPSAYWRNPDDPSDFRVGSEAKESAAEGKSPILFAKRKIGTTEVFRIGDSTFTARQVSAEILRYLKQCAEKYLGENTVRRAVITHPAYFDRNQVIETRLAAEDAGFDMSIEDEQMMMEPSAAALSFIHADPRDPLRILIYDLGGGTFDVTVLERREGVITKLAFGGDPLLGGYNFDRAFVQWLLNRVRKGLEGSGRTLTLDPEQRPEDMSRWSQLLQLAERVKEELTRKRTAQMPFTITAKDILVDDDGKPIQIQDRITREEYARIGEERSAAEKDDESAEEELETGKLSIPEFINSTIVAARQAIEKAGLTEAQIDLMILVGGSTHGQWIQEAVANAFSCEVNVHYSPDLCVAAGAALQAANLPPPATGKGDRIEIVPDVARTSPNPIISVAGTVRRDDGSELDADTLSTLEVLLHLPDARHSGPVRAGIGGVVVFDDVELLDDQPSPLRFEVIDQRGEPVCEYSFEVLYDFDGEDPHLPPILPAVPKPIYLRTASGLVLIADEGEQLPTKPRQLLLEQLHDEDSLDLEMFQGDHKITTIELRDLPEDVGAGSEVVLELKITKRNIMQGQVKVLRKPREASPGEEPVVEDEEARVAARQPVKISFPPIIIPELAELERKLRQLEARREELLDPRITPDDERRAKLGGAGGKLTRRIRALFAEEVKDRQEIYQALQSLESLINPSADVMQPSLAQFENGLRECRRQIAAAAEGSDAVAWGERADRIETEGRNAYVQRDRKQWGRAFDKLAKLVSDVRGDGKEDDAKEETKLPETKVLKTHFYNTYIEPLEAQYRNQLAALRNHEAYETKLKPRGVDIRNRISKLKQDLEAVPDDTDRKQAAMMIQSLVRKQAPRISKMIRQWPETVRVKQT